MNELSYDIDIRVRQKRVHVLDLESHKAFSSYMSESGYIKKKLSDRMYNLADGTLVQRDWYSSFLLYCYNYKTETIDKDKCFLKFEDCYNKEKSPNRMD